MISFHIDYHMYGTPTVRTDLVAPQIKRVSDSTNYSDQTTAFDLLYPTLYSLRGVHKEHFFCPRTKEEVQNTNEPTEESRERKKDMV